jgi:hypothetical protein
MTKDPTVGAANRRTLGSSRTGSSPMTQNMGQKDRTIRAAVAAPALILIALIGLGSALGIVAAVLAVVMLTTAALGFCPLYMPFHIHTNR